VFTFPGRGNRRNRCRRRAAVSEGDPPVEIIEAGDLGGLRRLIEQSSVYVNVHTVDHAGGEIRGQMLPRHR
jgi:hypothetical protein